MISPPAERTFSSERHRTFYLESGPADGPLLIFVHGWPEMAFMWHAQLEHFGRLGYRCIAPDMRGYGGSSIPPRRDDYALEFIVQDMLELLQGLGEARATWIGHDWGSPVVWSLAQHHPAACRGVANLCVPYQANGFAPENLLPFVDRTIYPEAEFPAGQWDYQLFYQSNFDAATTCFEANLSGTFKAMIRTGKPEGRGKPAPTAFIRRNGGWFGGIGRAPDFPRDAKVLSEDELARYVAAFELSGFAGADSWYMNHAANIRYAGRAPGRAIATPALFFHAAYDYICETVDSRLADPMRADCTQLTEHVLQTGHWAVQEEPAQINAVMETWLHGLS